MYQMESLNSTITQCSVFITQHYVQTALHAPFYAFLARTDGQTDKTDSRVRPSALMFLTLNI